MQKEKSRQTSKEKEQPTLCNSSSSHEQHNKLHTTSILKKKEKKSVRLD